MARPRDGDRGGSRAVPFGLELTEADPDLALRGFIISRTGVLPTDPSFRELCANEELLSFTAHWLNKREDDFMTQLGRMLGVLWTREQVAAMTADKRPSARSPTETFIPLSAAINGDIVEALQKFFRVTTGRFIGGGEYQPTEGEEVVNLADLPKDQFIEIAQRAAGAMREAANNFSSRQRTVTISEGDPDDPRLQRAREQVAESKKWRT